MMWAAGIFVCVFLKGNVCFYSHAVRVAHPVANRGASGSFVWKNAWHLASSPWLLAAGWHRNVSFLVSEPKALYLAKYRDYLWQEGAASEKNTDIYRTWRVIHSEFFHTAKNSFFIWYVPICFSWRDFLSDMATLAGKTFKMIPVMRFWMSPSKQRCIKATTWRWRTSSWRGASRQFAAFA